MILEKDVKGRYFPGFDYSELAEEKDQSIGEVKYTARRCLRWVFDLLIGEDKFDAEIQLNDMITFTATYDKGRQQYILSEGVNQIEDKLSQNQLNKSSSYYLIRQSINVGFVAIEMSGNSFSALQQQYPSIGNTQAESGSEENADYYLEGQFSPPHGICTITYPLNVTHGFDGTMGIATGKEPIALPIDIEIENAQ